jgi:hypothetical protein
MEKKDMNFHNDEEKKIRKIKRAALALWITALLVIISCASYLITDRLTNPKYSEGSNVSNEEEKVVYNNTKALDDDMIIRLMNNGQLESEESIAEFKSNNGISTDISEQFIVNFYLTEGYEIIALNDNLMEFSKISETVTLEPNKYYIGEKDGYLAIYKTDQNGKAFIEDKKDIYSMPLKSIHPSVQEEIKGFKHVYNTKEEAKIGISEYAS